MSRSTFLSTGIVLLAGSTLLAATRSERSRQAADLVQEALHREVYGLNGDRADLLGQALQTMPECESARWHLGEVKFGKKWVPADDVPKLLDEDPRVQTYRRIRSRYPATVASQLELADWCEKKGLDDQERAHLMRVLDIDPNHAVARARLGFQRFGDSWISEAERMAMVERLERDRKAAKRWQSLMESVRKAFSRSGRATQEHAARRLSEIRDPSAIAPMEQIVAPVSEAAAVQVVEALSNIPSLEASAALVRQAVFGRSERIRMAAAVKLRERKLEEYVPTILNSMSTPVTSRARLFRAPGGQLLYRHTLEREGADRRDVMVLDTAYRRIALPGGDRLETFGRAREDAEMQRMSREFSVARENAQTQWLNERLMSALKFATNQEIADRPENWWDWWNVENEVFVEGQKPTAYSRRTEQFALADYASENILPETIGTIATPPRRTRTMADCLVAGTPIWTSLGPVAVEQIEPGDLVLAQDPDSGQLAYKPVLRTTLRPKGQLVKIQAGESTLETSGGHLFWVAGEGWVKARHLKSGMELHSFQGAVRVSLVTTGRELETHNLIVADFNTYFAGEGRVLCHDNTIKQPTLAIVPGLTLR